VGGAATTLICAGLCFIALGAVLFGLKELPATLQGVAAVAFGVTLLLSVGSLKALAKAEEPTTGDLTAATRCLTWVALAQAAFAILAAVAIALSLAAKFTT